MAKKIKKAQKGINIDSVLTANKDLEWVKRLYQKDTPSIQIPGQKGTSTHFMESGDGRVYPTVVNKNGKLEYLGDKSYDYADSTKTFIQFPNDEQAQWFGENYKQGKGVLKQQMSGTLPGMTGNIYARDGAPSNGKRAKKTLPSAQKGTQIGEKEKAKVDSVDNELMLRQLYRESRFKENAYNKGSKAAGLAQLRPIAIDELKTKHKLSVDPLKGAQAIKAHKKLMTVNFNKSWIGKEDSTEEVKNAKTLAAYNWGPTSLINVLNAQKAKGVDIDKSTKWVEALPKETRDYIYDITGKNLEFEKEYKKAVKDFKFKGAYPINQNGGFHPPFVGSNRKVNIVTGDADYDKLLAEEQDYRREGHNTNQWNNYLKENIQKIKESKTKVVEDDMGYWNPKNFGKPVKINSNKITMKGVNQPLIGVSDTGDTQFMQPNQDYSFKGKNVIEYPMTNQDKGQLKKLDQLTSMAKSGIHIKESKKGTFTAAAKKHGKSVQGFASQVMAHKENYSPAMVKKANFAKNAAKWHKGQFGLETIAPEGSAAIQLNSAGAINPNQAFDNTTGQLTSAGKQALQPGKSNVMGKLGGIGGVMDIGSNLIQGASMLKEERDQKNQAKQFAALSGVVNQASSIRPEGPKRKYVRPEYQIFDPNQMSPSYGTGSNFLQAQNGIDLSDRYNPKDSTYTTFIQKPEGVRSYMGKNSDIATAKKKALSKSRTSPDSGGWINKSDSVNYFANKRMKKGGEIQNTYAPNTLYEGLEEIPRAQFGLANKTGGIGAWAGSKLFGGTGEQSGAGKIGSTIGDVAGKFIPIPGASAVLSGVGGLIGGAFGAKSQRQTADWNEEGMQNMQNAAFQQGSQQIQNQYSGFMEHGGNTNPQVISQFGDHKLSQLLKADPMMDTLRAGGHLKEYTAPSEEAMTPYAMGGALKTHWGGKAEEVSHNPYLPGSGESVQFRGQSHNDGGIGVTFGNSPVEVEGGEPAMKLQDGGGVDNLVVFGDMKIPSYGVTEIGDPKAKGKKFKNYITDLNKIEARQNNVRDKGTDYINNADTNDPYDSLKEKTGEAMRIGANMKLKDIAQKKQMASAVQKAILETADEHGLKADELAKGKFKKAKQGANIAQNGTILDRESPFMQWVRDFQTMPGKTEPTGNRGEAEATNELIKKIPGVVGTGQYPKKGYPLPHESGLNRTPIDGYQLEGYTPRKQSEFERISAEVDPDKTYFGYGQYYYPKDGQGTGISEPAVKPNDIRKKDPITTAKKQATIYSKMKAPAMANFEGNLDSPELTAMQDLAERNNNQNLSTERTPQGGKAKSKSDLSWLDAVGAYLPYLRPSNQKNLDPNQLMGEMNALAANNLEPVQSQRYNPLLEQATDYSFQDQLNANQADFNAIKRQVGNNPEALASLAAQKYGANAGVLANQFRTNQEQKQGVYNRNRGVLNDATLKNLAIMDQQYSRQAQAKSNTKAVAQAALSSISDKIAKNKLENKTLGVYENLYNYRFGPQGRAWNMNAPVDFQQMVANANPQATDDDVTRVRETTKWDSKNMFKGRERQTTTDKKNAKNGSIVKAMKR